MRVYFSCPFFGGASPPAASLPLTKQIPAVSWPTPAPRFTLPRDPPGYAASEQALLSIERAVSMIRAARPPASQPLVYVCDPVLGDNGVLYVPESLIPLYRARILPLAQVLTPNAFELARLADVPPPRDEAALFAACDALHAAHAIPTIVVTGATFAARPGVVSMYASRRPRGGAAERYAFDADLLPSAFTGSGDLTSALVLAWGEKLPARPADAYARVMSTVTAVLRRTLAEADAEGDAWRARCKLPELALVQSAQDVMDPPTGLVRVRLVPAGGDATQASN